MVNNKIILGIICCGFAGLCKFFIAFAGSLQDTGLPIETMTVLFGHLSTLMLISGIIFVIIGISGVHFMRLKIVLRRHNPPFQK